MTARTVRFRPDWDEGRCLSVLRPLLNMSFGVKLRSGCVRFVDTFRTIWEQLTESASLRRRNVWLGMGKKIHFVVALFQRTSSADQKRSCSPSSKLSACFSNDDSMERVVLDVAVYVLKSSLRDNGRGSALPTIYGSRNAVPVSNTYSAR